MEANQEPTTANTGKESVASVTTGLLERIRSGELKARLQYFLFRQSQQVHLADSFWSKYKQSLSADWQSWLGLAAGIVGLVMLLSPEKFWFWQIPFVVLLVLLIPVCFEIPALLNQFFGHQEQQHLVGKTITLTQPIVDGHGQTVLEGREWQVSGPDCPTGQVAKIVTLDAKTLYIIPLTAKRGTPA